MRSQLLSEISRSGRRRWLQVDEMPFSRAVTYKLIDAGLISSVVVSWPGSRRGRRLIDGDSLDSYLESLTAGGKLPLIGRRRDPIMEVSPERSPWTPAGLEEDIFDEAWRRMRETA